MELNLLQQANRDEKKRQIQLEQEHEALTEELTKEKVPQTLIPNILTHTDNMRSVSTFLLSSGSCGLFDYTGGAGKRGV